MSNNEIILLAWFSPILICVVAIPPALVVWVCEKIIPFLWRHYPRWWRVFQGRPLR
jgi:hypothetical protein